MKRIFERVEKNIDHLVEQDVLWSQCVSDEEMQSAKNGKIDLHLTQTRKIPEDWLPSSVKGLKILCLAGAGGQQAPILSMAGADVTVIDLSEKMLEKDRQMAEKYGLDIRCVHGNMCSMECFADNTFDMIVNPASLMYVPDVSVVFQECSRVLKKGGCIILAAPAPVVYLCDWVEEGGYYKACNRMPYRSYEHDGQGEWIEFGHTMEEYLGGLLAAGFCISGYLEEQLEDITELYFLVKANKR
ncbi:MAG: class I SAM-dependent methyltransferase [Lachnospiraceae bacterium]|nr:class I SAM-dependent methyltransferase [Lachnospiraceae bacterium]